MSIYGFNQGYGLSAMNLSDIPSPSHGPGTVRALNSLYTPNILTLNSPSANIAHVQQSLSLAGSSGQYNLNAAQKQLALAAAAPPPVRIKCRNVNETNLDTSGSAQCIDTQGNCYPPINMRCPENSVFLDQFSGLTGSSSVMSSTFPLLR